MSEEKSRAWHVIPRPELPGNGDAIWVVVREKCGSTHVEYAQTWVESDGLMVTRFEKRDSDRWPPEDLVAWMPCDEPEFEEDT